MQYLISKFILKLGKGEGFEENFLRVVRIFYLLNLSTLIIFSIGIVLNAIEQKYFNTAIFAGLLLYNVINFFIFKFNHNYSLFKFLSLFVFFLTLVFFFSPEIDVVYLLVWFLAFPILTGFLFEMRHGLIIIVSFFITIVSIYFLVSVIQIVNTANLQPIIVFSLLYFLLFVISAAFNQVYKNHTQTIEKQLLEKEKLLSEKNAFISKLSYQIRTPLNNILGLSNLLRESSLGDTELGLIETLRASINNITEVVARIDAQSKQTTDVLEKSKVVFDIRNSVQSVASLFSKSFKIIPNISPDLPEKVIGSPIQIKQLFLHLFELFNKARQQKNLTIYLTINKGNLFESNIECRFVLCSDNMLQLTDGNDQSNSSNSLDTLDFDVAKDLIISMGGSLKVRNDEDKSCMFFSLFFETNSTDLVGNVIKKVVTPVSPVMNSIRVELKNARILVVEDNIINQKVMVLSLQKVVKEIDIAFNGKEAIDKYTKNVYDLILMDIQMPIMDGIKATKKIREIEKGGSKRVPIIAVTANTLSGDMEECLAAGMDDYVSKPFQLINVMDKMNTLLSGNANA